MRLLLLFFAFFYILFADNINFDFEDARAKGYSDKEILDYVSKNLNTSYDVKSIRGAGLNDEEIINFLIQRDSVSSKINLLKKTIDKSILNLEFFTPLELSSNLSKGCLLYIAREEINENSWVYINRLKDFAQTIYAIKYLEAANYYDISNAPAVTLKTICAKWLDVLKSDEERERLYALSLTNEISKIIKEKKYLFIE